SHRQSPASFLYRVGVRVEVWSDVVCPWCYVGKRRLESALRRFEHREDVELVWRSFELDPEAPRQREGSAAEHLARKYGMSGEEVVAERARLTALTVTEGAESMCCRRGRGLRRSRRRRGWSPTSSSRGAARRSMRTG